MEAVPLNDDTTCICIEASAGQHPLSSRPIPSSCLPIKARLLATSDYGLLCLLGLYFLRKGMGSTGVGRSQTWFPWARTEESLPPRRLPQPGLTLPCLLGRESTGKEGVEFMMMAEAAHVMVDQEAENVIGTRGWP